MSGQSNQLILSVFNYGPAWVRRFMVRQLGGRDPSMANTLLPLAIRDRNPSVRLTALEVVAAHRRQQDLALLSLALHDPHVAVREASARTLEQFRSIQAGSLLQEALGDPHPHVRRAAASALGQVPTLQFSAALESTLADNDAQVRAAAATSLGKVGRAEACVPLRKMAASDLDHRNHEIARQAIEAIQRRTASPTEKKHQARVDLIGVLTDPRRSWEERQDAKASLMHRGDESIIPDLDKALIDSNDDQVRVDIVEVLAALPPCDQLQTTLLGYLHHVSSCVRRRAIVALGNVGDQKAIFYLNEVAREGDQPKHWLTPEDSRLAREAIRKIQERTG